MVGNYNGCDSKPFEVSGGCSCTLNTHISVDITSSAFSLISSSKQRSSFTFFSLRKILQTFPDCISGPFPMVSWQLCWLRSPSLLDHWVHDLQAVKCGTITTPVITLWIYTDSWGPLSITLAEFTGRNSLASPHVICFAFGSSLLP